MFCPKCGDELVKVGTELTCVRGQMGLSQNMECRLTECFISRNVAPRESNSQQWWAENGFVQAAVSRHQKRMELFVVRNVS